MSANTIAANKLRHDLDGRPSIWLFGYGSLLFKTEFPYIEQRAASIMDWTRRFWQGSHDHRGTAESPGRVVTLIAQQGAICEGVAYLITPQVFDDLDVREKNGYLRFCTALKFNDASTVEGFVYIAPEENPAFLGPASELDIARHIAVSAGPSGRNRDYVSDLAHALRALSADDPHVFAIEKHLLALDQT